MSSNSVCNHTRDKQIGLSLRGRPILLSLVRAVNRIWSWRWYFESRRLWGPKAPTQARGLGAADAPSGVQGQSPVGGPGGESSRKQNEFNVWHCQKLTFLIFTQYVLKWMADKIPEKIVGTPTPKKILKSRVLQMPFPTFSRRISHQKDNHNREQKTFVKSTFAVSSSYAC